jgi:hypothetical protein
VSHLQAGVLVVAVCIIAVAYLLTLFSGFRR